MHATPTATEVVRALRADDIARRLDALAAEQRALRTLLRAARAMERGQQPRGEAAR
jgi:hypothetical protein